jgi:hypothetical protein
MMNVEEIVIPGRSYEFGRMEFKQAEELYSELIMGAMRDNRGNVSAMQAAMRAIPAQVLELTGWSVEEIQARTQRETGERIQAMKQGRPERE